MTNRNQHVAKHASSLEPPSRSHLIWFIAAFIVVVTIACVVAYSIIKSQHNTQTVASGLRSQPAGETAQSMPDSDKNPITASQKLLQSSTDPNACAVTFTGTNITNDPVLETEGKLYQNLPQIDPQGDQVFAGWYQSSEDAATRNQEARLNGSKVVACDSQEKTLYAGWISQAENIDTATRVPILMYHQFTTNPEGEDSWLSANYVYIDDFKAHLQYISDQGFYLPTWKELSSFIDGNLYLPQKSLMITDDDADPTWVELAAPLTEEFQIPVTSFVITSNGAGPELSQFVWKRSHTHDMHTAGDNGKGRMVNWTTEEIAADLETSAEVLGGAKEVIAYPYGHYNDTAKAGLQMAGYDLARTIDQGYVSIGTDKYALPCIRINYGMTVDDLAQAIG